MRVLVLDGDSAAALESLQSLGRRGAQVDVACERDDCLAFHSRYVRRRLQQPPAYAGRDAVQWLARQDRERDYALIVPATEASLLLLRALQEEHPTRRKAALPADAALDIALDKQATLQLAARLGIAVPATVLIEHAAAPCARYPVVLKSVRSRVRIDGRDVRLPAVLARDAAAHAHVLTQWLPYTPVLQQEFVVGHGFGIAMLFERGRPVWHFAHERLHENPLTGGGSTYRRSIEPPPLLLQAAERLLRHLHWHGVAMVEFRGDAQRWHLMEINPRLWGSLALSIDCGVDFPWGLAMLAAGAALPALPRYRRGYYTRQVLYDVTWQKLNLRADHADALLLTRPRLRSLLELLRPLWGAESWDHFDWRDLGIVARVLGISWGMEIERLRGRLGALRLAKQGRGARL